MSNLSLDASLRTCKVESGYAANFESDRFLNPNNMVCIPWLGTNLKGQQVCVDSQYTKSAGCNSAEDRVLVESALRPDYAAYINLNMSGIQGNIYGGAPASSGGNREFYGGNEMAFKRMGHANKWANSRNEISGHYGNQWGSSNIDSCGMDAYSQGMSQVARRNRQAAAANNGFNSNSKRRAAGGGY